MGMTDPWKPNTGQVTGVVGPDHLRAAQRAIDAMTPPVSAAGGNAGRGLAAALSADHLGGFVSPATYRHFGPDYAVGGSMAPEAIDDPNERLKALAERDCTHDKDARSEASRVFFRDMVWRPYVRAGMPYGDTEDDAKRWAEEQKAARIDDDVDMSWFTMPDGAGILYRVGNLMANAYRLKAP